MISRLNKAAANNLAIALFLLIVLFVPKTTAFTRPFFAIILVALPLFLGNTRKLYFDYFTLIGISIVVIHLISTFLRFGFIVDPNLRDYTEVARLFLPVLMLIFREKFKDLRVRTLFLVLSIYTGIDFSVSVLDFLNMDPMGIVSLTKSVYVSGVHANVSYRVDGLSPGPAQHGVTMLIMFTFFYCRIFRSKNIIWPIVFSFFSAIPIFLSQSRTCMVAFALVSLGVPAFYLMFGQHSARKRSIPALVFLVSCGGFVLYRFQDFFSRLFVLLEGIGGISSYKDRLEGYEMLFNKAMEHPAFLAIGYGKEYFKTSVFDSEYVMMLLVYGPFITLIILTCIIAFLSFFILRKKKANYFYNTVLFFLLVIGLLIAYPSSFLLDAGIIPLLFTFVILAYWEYNLTENS